MRNMILSFVAVAALVVPVAAFADDAVPAPSTLAAQICKQEQATLKADFAKTYGTNASRSNAYGKCVAKSAGNAQRAITNAAKSCKAERTADPAAFDLKYGTNGKGGSAGGRNAFGKCVSTLAKASAAADAAAAPSGAKQCKADAKADAAAYAAKYGTGRDALGKCVAARSHSK